ncbi:hypothetical protein MmiEs2_15880 [Methanimicrococcus stummii]|uniref:Fibronectin type-III domain-containing protein n=1 Tax=Methanimicrococcus stummii TaxID=3028294 RepID=A0AA96ZYX8_9EURY|nr:fibronectin type III domain-containing protein [Methanimicrococcus sp. Es2]WNY29361.1 hypothetical protein MmiEs2_15880 [Methanimicrococcus sp. Es2]
MVKIQTFKQSISVLILAALLLFSLTGTAAAAINPPENFMADLWGSSIELNWDYEPAAVGYIIERSTDDFATIEKTYTITGTYQTYYEDYEDLSPNTKYYYRIASVSSTNEKGWSQPIDITSPKTIPGKVQNVVAKAIITDNII